MRTTAIAVLLCLATTSRGEETSVGDEFYPTAVGTTWILRSTFESGLPDDRTEVRVTDVRVVNGHRKWRIRVRNSPWPRTTLEAIGRIFAKPAGDVDEFDSWEYYDVGIEAYVNRAIDEEDDSPYPLVYYPARKGDVFETGDARITVVDLAREVTVPAGTYRCIVYEYRYGEVSSDEERAGDAPAAEPDGDEEAPPEEEEEAPVPESGPEFEEIVEPTVTLEYWAKGVGMVKADSYDVTDDGLKRTSTQVLVSFRTPSAATDTSK